MGMNFALERHPIFDAKYTCILTQQLCNCQKKKSPVSYFNLLVFLTYTDDPWWYKQKDKKHNILFNEKNVLYYITVVLYYIIIIL